MARNTPTADPVDETPAPELPGSRFFGWMRGLDVPRQPGWIGGVCAGIAARVGIDPLIVRGVFVVVAVLGGPALILYAAGWLMLPDHRGKIHLEELFRGRFESPIAGIGVMVLLSLLPVAQGFWYAGAGFWGEPSWGDSLGRVLWTLVVLGLIVWFIVWIARRGASGSITPTTSPATTDARPETIPEPQPEGAAAFPRPAAPPADASTADLAAWREQQAAWKAERDEFRRQEAESAREANRQRAEEARARSAAGAADRAELRRAEQARRARTRPHPLYSFIVVGVAFIAGGGAALGLSGGELDLTAIVGGLASALTVLAVGVIVSGVIGKRSGGIGALATLVLLPLIAVAIFPPSSHLVYTGGARFAPVYEPNREQAFYVGTGDVRLDLRDFFDRSPDADPDTRAAEQVTLLVGAGDIDILLPGDVAVGVDASTGRGVVHGEGANGTVHYFEGPNGAEGPTISVRVLVGAGDITIDREAPTND
jgi:phage shock protein PspC (stress-responsive transcriptional regulator)